jgi:hypothetical protein
VPATCGSLVLIRLTVAQKQLDAWPREPFGIAENRLNGEADARTRIGGHFITSERGPGYVRVGSESRDPNRPPVPAVLECGPAMHAVLPTSDLARRSPD